MTPSSLSKNYVAHWKKFRWSWRWSLRYLGSTVDYHELVSPKVPMDTSPTYRAQLALQAVTATQWQLVSRTKHPANRLAMAHGDTMAHNLVEYLQ